MPGSQSLDEQLQQLRTENADLKRELEEARRSTTQYLQNVAHQLTAPLNAIKWNIEAIKDEKIPIPRKKNLLSSIYSQGTILVHLIKNFSLMSNLEADHELGQFRDQPERVSPLRLAINLAGDFEPQAAETSKKIEVHVLSFDRVFPEKSLLLVKNLVAQALSNLLENAIKYSSIGTTIYVEALTDTGRGMSGISVRNTGLPILPTEIKKLSERGFRGSAAKQRIPAGTGIGLYIANRIMELHEGMILVNAKGSDIRMTLLFPTSRVVDEINPGER
jgi:two-component system phosphate regulon sensor histidine kinase PhoR